MGSTCDDNGQCHCNPNFDGDKCDRCKEQYYNYPACEECNCDPRGVTASFAGKLYFRERPYIKQEPFTAERR